MSTSSINDLLHYCRERFQVRVFAPVAVVLTLASFSAMTPQNLMPGLLSLALSFSLLFQFRLWDDLADRAGDCIRHPERVLCGPVQLKWFYGTVIVLCLFNFILLWFIHHAIEFTVLCTLTALWYFAFSERRRLSIAGRHLLLLKYPA